MDLVEKRKLFQVVGGKKYLHAEAWITIGAFNQIVAQTDSITPERDDDGVITGYDAKVSLIHTPTGEVRGGAIMSCGLDSFPCRGKNGSEKHKAAKSAAQTWAVSKAFRMTHSYVPVLAGYEATPAEEMGRDEPESPPRQHSRTAGPRRAAPQPPPETQSQSETPAEPGSPVAGTDPQAWFRDQITSRGITGDQVRAALGGMGLSEWMNQDEAERTWQKALEVVEVHVAATT